MQNESLAALNLTRLFHLGTDLSCFLASQSSIMIGFLDRTSVRSLALLTAIRERKVEARVRVEHFHRLQLSAILKSRDAVGSFCCHK
jgi:hypothetical protein